MCGYYHTEKLPHTGEFSLLLIYYYYDPFWLYTCHMFQWMERKADGGVVFRSARAEEKEERRFSSHKQKAMEILFAKIQTEYENEEKGKNVFGMLNADWNKRSFNKLSSSGNNKPKRRRRTISSQYIASLQDGEELYEAVGDDPAYLEVIGNLFHRLLT